MTEERKVDWGRPIKAVHEDGWVVAAAVSGGPYCDGDYTVNFDSNIDLWARADGRVMATNWHIRNVAQSYDDTVQLPTLPDDLTARMVALVKRVAGDEHWSDTAEARAITREARAIVAEMEPVDGDLIEARELSAVWCDAIGLDGMARHFRAGDCDQQALAVHRVVRRALERGEGK